MVSSQIAITNIPEISAVYFGLLQSGYEFYGMDRCPSLTAELEAFTNQRPIPFFTGARQNTCQVYPYWPRAALLETASFYVNRQSRCFRNMAELHSRVMSAGNIGDDERGPALWAWLNDFPDELCGVMDSQGFQSYLKWENEWIGKQNSVYQQELACIQRCIDQCIQQYASPVRQLQIVINPIKCKHAADYHLLGERFVFSSGDFRAESVIHEFLHPVVHPAVVTHRVDILRGNSCYPELDSSYYLSGDDDGKCNAFEEFLVRQLTAAALRDDLPNNVDDYIRMTIK